MIFENVKFLEDNEYFVGQFTFSINLVNYDNKFGLLHHSVTIPLNNFKIFAYHCKVADICWKEDH